MKNCLFNQFIDSSVGKAAKDAKFLLEKRQKMPNFCWKSGNSPFYNLKISDLCLRGKLTHIYATITRQIVMLS
jgi:hypothetical protein